MVIDPNSVGNAATASAKNKLAGGEGVRSESKKAETPSVQRVGDNVSLSPEAQSIGKLESAVENAPSVDASKVDEVRSALVSGQYKIDAEAIAGKLLDQESLL